MLKIVFRILLRLSITFIFFYFAVGSAEYYAPKGSDGTVLLIGWLGCSITVTFVFRLAQPEIDQARKLKAQDRRVNQVPNSLEMRGEDDEADDDPGISLLDLVGNPDAVAAADAVSHSLDQLFARLGPPPEGTGSEKLLMPTRGGGGHQ